MHRIVDGDTLAGLAQRYLGSSARFREIYDANRDQLPGPDLLPIGVEVRIPAVAADRGD
jgi:nucleoid-associated protein YgaU